MESKTFCIYPWIHMYVNPDGSVLPCCVGHHHSHLGNVREKSVEEIWNDEPYKLMRKNMINGIQCKECVGCYKMEQSGVESVRQSKNKVYQEFVSLVDKTNPDGSLPTMDLKHFDVRWSNICNFKCRSCSSTYSSTWAQEDNAQGKSKPIYILAGGNDNDHLYDQFKPYLKGIKTFYFAGGEPLLTDKHYEILEHLIETGNTDVEIEYNTNLSNLVYKGKSVIDLWNKFSKVKVGASFDSWGDRAEYIREGTEWSKVVDNIMAIRQQAPHVELNTGSVISVFNITTIPEFLQYMIDNKLMVNGYYPHFYNIINPDFYSVSVLPESVKEQIIKKLEKNSSSFNNHINKEIKKVISYLENSKYDKTLHEQFLSVTEYYDSIRNRKFAETFPELLELLQ